MRMGQDVLSDLRTALATEWWFANGLGGSGSGTAAGANARRTHALLTAAGPHGRLTSLLLKLDERVLDPLGSYDLACNLHAGGTARPSGHLLLEEFRLEPWPTWRYRAGGVVLEKTVFPISGHNAVAVGYRHVAGGEARLTLSPLVAARDPWALQHEHADMRGAAQGVPGRVRIEVAADRPALMLWHNGAFIPARVWQRDLHYPLDRVPRGAPEPVEDAFVPGHIEGGIAAGRELFVVASAEDDLFRALAAEDRLGTPPPRTLAECVTVLERGERDRLALEARAAVEGADFTARQAAAAHGGEGEAAARRRAPLVAADDPWVPGLTASLFSALTRRPRRLALLPVLPCGEERVADSLRAVPGLVSLRAFEPAREILRGAVEYLDEGLLPESFDPEDGTPRYGDAAPALWLVHAAEVYARRSEDAEFLGDPLYPALESVMQSYRGGTRGVRLDADGLLTAGEDEAAIPRSDLNALWYHALVAMAQLARLTGRKENGAFYLAWARELQGRFADRMWDEENGALFESLGLEGPEAGLGPGQLLAVGMAPALLPPDHAARLVETIERELFTPLGLRPYPGAHEVSTAWLGAFYSAYLRVKSRSAEAQAQVHEWLEALRTRLHVGPTLHVPALFAAVPAAASEPAHGDGSVSIVAAAEILRVWVEELDRAEQPAAIA